MSAKSNDQVRAEYTIRPIGVVRRQGEKRYVEIFDPFRRGMKHLDSFSHVNVLWWATRHDDVESRTWLQIEPPYAPGVMTGVFATRAPYRENPVALTTCKILSLDEKTGLLEIANIDAIDGTPVIDLKAYYPVTDRVKEAHIPAWLAGWPEWFPEEGIGLMEGEE
jgi:tRNA-Thr(GGU) m(6)t(6)A37 methyltransferase TsaA